MHVHSLTNLYPGLLWKPRELYEAISLMLLSPSLWYRKLYFTSILIAAVVRTFSVSCYEWQPRGLSMVLVSFCSWVELSGRSQLCRCTTVLVLVLHLPWTVECTGEQHICCHCSIVTSRNFVSSGWGLKWVRKVKFWWTTCISDTFSVWCSIVLVVFRQSTKCSCSRQQWCHTISNWMIVFYSWFALSHTQLFSQGLCHYGSDVAMFFIFLFVWSTRSR